MLASSALETDSGVPVSSVTMPTLIKPTAVRVIVISTSRWESTGGTHMHIIRQPAAPACNAHPGAQPLKSFSVSYLPRERQLFQLGKQCNYICGDNAP